VQQAAADAASAAVASAEALASERAKRRGSNFNSGDEPDIKGTEDPAIIVPYRESKLTMILKVTLTLTLREQAHHDPEGRSRTLSHSH
jgi:hypothetical protein